mgnify:CR=1 FL=1
MRIYLLALFAVLATLPFEGLTIMGLPLARTTGLLLILAFFLKVLFSYSDGLSINRNHFFVLLALTLLILFSTLRSNNTDSALVIAISLIGNLLFFVIFCNLVKTTNTFSLSILVVAFSFFLSTIISVNIDTQVIQISDELSDDLRFSDLRQAGFLRNANRYGYFALLVFWCGTILYALKLTSNKLSLAITLIGAVTVILSMSRAVILGLAFGLIYYIFIWNAKRAAVALFFGCFVVLTAPIFLSVNQEENILTNMLINRFQPEVLLNSGSTSARTSIWQDTIQRIDENPLLGVPLGSLEGVIGMSGHKTHEPHNTFLYILQYFGIIGLIVILGYFLWLLSIFLSADLNKNIRLLLLIFSVSMLIPNIFHTTLTWKPTLLMFCYIVSIMKFSRNNTLPSSNS